MIILKTLATAQPFAVIPRSYHTDFIMDIRDDSTNVTVSYEITGALLPTSGGELKFTNIFSPVLVEGHFYDMELYKSDKANSIYKDRIFCTDQVIDQSTDDYYKLNKDQFITYNGFDNTYIVI
tara:strand:- start:10 stop:378 length:369 start_codon:yes stop_codon:yes gene_type:complete